MTSRVARPCSGGFVAVLLFATGIWTSPAEAQSRHRTYFVGTDGVPVLTNRPERYRAHPHYEEVRIAFDPIVVTGRYTLDAGGGYSPDTFAQLVHHYADANRLDPNMVFAVIKAESAFDPYAVSSAGARGLMQLMPGTAAEMQVTDLFDPEQNIAGGTQYLSKLMDAFDNNIDYALAPYNAGPGTVRKYGGIPPYKETQDYIRKVRIFARQFARGDTQLPTVMLAKTHEEEYLPPGQAPLVVHYKSGATQPADAMREEKLFYVFEFKNRKYIVRKHHVDRIVKN